MADRSTCASMAAVLFDLDGTLLNTLGDIAESMNAALIERGFEGHPEDRYTGFVGDGVVQLAVRALPAEARQAQTIDRLVYRFREIYADRATDRSRPYPGIQSMLTELRQAGYHLAVNSNKPQAMCHRCLEALLPDHPFAAVVGQQNGKPLKPDPAGALDIARRIDIDPKTVVYVGDSDVDMRTAVNAGMHGAGVLWGFRTGRELRDNGAEALIEKPEDLPGLLRCWPHQE